MDLAAPALAAPLGDADVPDRGLQVSEKRGLQKSKKKRRGLQISGNINTEGYKCLKTETHGALLATLMYLPGRSICQKIIAKRASNEQKQQHRGPQLPEN